MPDKNLTDEPASPPSPHQVDDSDESAPSSPAFPHTPGSDWEDEEDYMFVKSHESRPKRNLKNSASYQVHSDDDSDSESDRRN